MHYLLWILVSSVFYALGEYFSKRYALEPRIHFVLLVVASYSIGVLLWLPAIRQRNHLIIASTIWSVIALGMTMLIGALVFGERLTPVNYVGLVCGALAVVLLSI